VKQAKKGKACHRCNLSSLLANVDYIAIRIIGGMSDIQLRVSWQELNSEEVKGVSIAYAQALAHSGLTEPTF
jgi:hypothetical protein